MKPESVPGYIADKDHAPAVKDFLTVNVDIDFGKLMIPERSPYRPEIIKMVYIAVTVAVNLMDDVPVKSETGNRGEALPVYFAKVERANLAIERLDKR